MSRPTLDTYIEMFESGQTIPKERYDIIFKRLFDYDNCSAEEFAKNFQQVENLLSRDQNMEQVIWNQRRQIMFR